VALQNGERGESQSSIVVFWNLLYSPAVIQWFLWRDISALVLWTLARARRADGAIANLYWRIRGDAKRRTYLSIGDLIRRAWMATQSVPFKVRYFRPARRVAFEVAQWSTNIRWTVETRLQSCAHRQRPSTHALPVVIAPMERLSIWISAFQLVYVLWTLEQWLRKARWLLLFFFDRYNKQKWYVYKRDICAFLHFFYVYQKLPHDANFNLLFHEV